MSHPVFTPTDGPVGAFVTGVDLSIPLAPYIAAAILTELGEHGVLFFRD